MRLIRRFHLILLAAAIVALPGCDLIGGHGRVNVVNNSGHALTSVQLIFENGNNETSGALGTGLTAEFTGIPAGHITAYGYASTSTSAVGQAFGTLKADQTLTLTLSPIGH